MSAPLDAAALDQLFVQARSNNGWTAETLPHALLREVYELAKWGPTEANTTPARFVFVTSDEARQTLSDAALGGNKPKILQAPCTVIIGYDLDFPSHHPRLFPAAPRMLDGVAPERAERMAWRNSSLQGAYLIVAARALGLDCGPMGGFDHDTVDAAFFAGTNVRSNFICSLGHGDPARVYPRGPRLAFEEACKIV